MQKAKQFSPEVRKLAKKIVTESAVKDSPRWGDLFPEVSDEIVGNRLCALRRKHKVKQGSVAEKMGVENTTICNLEKGRFRWCSQKVLDYVDAIVELSA